MAEDISNYLKFKNISKVDMLGHSMGGNLAIYISNKTTNKFEKENRELKRQLQAVSENRPAPKSQKNCRNLK